MIISHCFRISAQLNPLAMAIEDQTRRGLAAHRNEAHDPQGLACGFDALVPHGDLAALHASALGRKTSVGVFLFWVVLFLTKTLKI